MPSITLGYINVSYASAFFLEHIDSLESYQNVWWVYTRVQDQRNSQIKRSRANFGTQEIYSRVQVQGIFKKKVALI
jgi:hypothetical protein